MIRLAVGLSAWLVLVGHVGAGERSPVSLMQGCKGEFADRIADCACVVRFLESRYADDELDALLAAWAYSYPGWRHTGREVDELYARYGSAKLTDVLVRFHRIRLALFMQCPGAGPDGEDDQ